jgi:hypothetical protein
LCRADEPPVVVEDTGANRRGAGSQPLGKPVGQELSPAASGSVVTGAVKLWTVICAQIIFAEAAGTSPRMLDTGVMRPGSA